MPPARRTLLLAGGFALAAAATLAVFLTDNAVYLRVAVVAVAWAFVIAAFAAGRRDTDRVAAAARELELRRAYELELEREVAARHEYELELENELRRETEDSMRYELDALRGDIAALSGLRDEVARVSQLRGDIAALTSLRDEVARVAALHDDVAGAQLAARGARPARRAAGRHGPAAGRAHRAAVQRDAGRADRHAHPGQPAAGRPGPARRPGPHPGELDRTTSRRAS